MRLPDTVSCPPHGNWDSVSSLKPREAGYERRKWAVLRRGREKATSAERGVVVYIVDRMRRVGGD